MSADSDFQKLLNLRRAGVDPNLIRTFGPGAAEMLAGAGQQAKDIAGQAGTKVGEMRAGYAKRPGTYGMLAGTALSAAPQVFQGDLVGAAASTAGSLAGGGLGVLASNLLPKPIQPLARAVLPLAGGILGGGAAEKAAAGLGQSVEESKTGTGSSDIRIPGTNIPLTQGAREQIQAERDLANELKRLQTIGPAQLNLDRQVLYDQMNMRIAEQKAMLPLIERIDRQQAINTQAVLNTQYAGMQNLGRQAGMYKLAGQGAQNAADVMRTAISTNPYTGAILQAPSISFG